MSIKFMAGQYDFYHYSKFYCSSDPTTSLTEGLDSHLTIVIHANGGNIVAK